MYTNYSPTRWFFLGFYGSGKNVADFARLTGNASETFTFTQLVKYLEDKGWQYIQPNQLPLWFGGAIGSAQAFISTFGSLMSSPIPVIIIVPGDGELNYPGGIQGLN